MRRRIALLRGGKTNDLEREAAYASVPTAKMDLSEGRLIGEVWDFETWDGALVHLIREICNICNYCRLRTHIRV
jgi:hypothetical protein